MVSVSSVMPLQKKKAIGELDKKKAVSFEGGMAALPKKKAIGLSADVFELQKKK